jgi:hypothetical protein
MRGATAGSIKQPIVEPLRPNPRNKRDAIAISARSYRVKRTLSMRSVYQPSRIPKHRLLYWSIRGLPLKTLDVRVAPVPELNACRNPKTPVSD